MSCFENISFYAKKLRVNGVCYLGVQRGYIWRKCYEVSLHNWKPIVIKRSYWFGQNKIWSWWRLYGSDSNVQNTLISQCCFGSQNSLIWSWSLKSAQLIVLLCSSIITSVLLWAVQSSLFSKSYSFIKKICGWSL